MVARHAHRYVVTCRSDLAQVEDAIGKHREAVLVEANSDSSSLSEIEEFRCLAAAGRVAGVHISFASDDPLRRELARIVGLDVEEAQPAPSGVRRAIESNAPTRKIDRVEQQLPPTMPIEPAQSLTEALNEYTNHGTDESYASFAFIVNPPAARPAEQDDNWYYAGTARATYPHSRRPRSSRRVGRAAAIATIAAIALLIASSGVLMALIAPQATVTLVPTTSVITADVTYAVAGQSASADVVVDPSPVNGVLTYAATIPTTGVRSEPDGFAAGQITLTNPTTSELFIAAGTTLTAASGAAFTVVEDVSVPPADPFGSGAMGSALAPIQAVAAGPDSNIEAQSLSGQLNNGLFYSNREATSGGTMRDIAVVAEADLEALRADAEANLASRFDSEVAGLVPEGHQMVAGSQKAGDIDATFSAEPGSDATEVRIEASQAINADTYDPAALERLAADELNRRLAAAIPGESVLLADSISTSEPTQVPLESGNPEYRMSASARTRTVLDPEVLDALKKDLVGTSEDEAASKVALLTGVAGYTIEYGPDWFPLDWPPRLESRIAIHIDDSAATEEATGTTRP